jgi:pimeloyl-ACP methyl ester carboxylesterase
MDIVLVPGLWLDASSWDEVTPALEAAGHRVTAVQLPGMESRDADRAAITLDDHVAAVVAAIDAAEGPVILVGHSAGSGIASAAVDARPDRVARAIYVGGFPSPDGDQLINGFEAVDGEIPLPEFSEFSADDLRDLDDAALARFRERGVPSPEHVVHGTVHLHDERRYAVPVTAICPEYTAADLQSWITGGEPSVQEFARIADVTYVDLPTGHWPQFTRPAELAALILEQPPLAKGAVGA